MDEQPPGIALVLIANMPQRMPTCPFMVNYSEIRIASSLQVLHVQTLATLSILTWHVCSTPGSHH